MCIFPPWSADHAVSLHLGLWIMLHLSAWSADHAVSFHIGLWIIRSGPFVVSLDLNLLISGDEIQMAG